MASLNLTGVAERHGLNTTAEIAAALALMALESKDFKTNFRSLNGAAQGTRVMMADYHAIAVYTSNMGGRNETFSKLTNNLIKPILQSPTCNPANILPPTHDPSPPNETESILTVLKLVNSVPSFDVGAGFWFIFLQQENHHRMDGSESAFENMVEDNMQRRLLPQSSKEDVQMYWSRACAALGGC